MTDHLALWNKLGKTDPKHTKPFSRSGGFKGTAVKPIYTEQKMTEEFGPCGVGWGISEPQFQVVPGSEGQVAVYCWASIWFNYEGKVSAPVPGVGGDIVVVSQKDRLRTDDEAFKKAFTDAIGNAMKHIGMSADVHMGRFDDSKYLREREAEEAGGAPPRGAVTTAAEFTNSINKATTETELKAVWDRLNTTTQEELTEREFEALAAALNGKLTALKNPAAKNLGAHLDNLERQTEAN